MAPSVRGTSSRVSKRQTEVQNYAKVSKSAKSRAQLKTAVKELELVEATKKKETPRSSSKRKRSDVHDDSETEPESPRVTAIGLKKAKVQLATPPESEREEEDPIDIDQSIDFRQLSLGSKTARRNSVSDLPETLRDLVSLHSSFLRAFSLQLVHNGNSSTAELNSLMSSVTRLWKKHTVTKEDIQRMLAIYELGSPSDHALGQSLKHKASPFKMNLAGGNALRYSVEYVAPKAYDEKKFQKQYEVEVEAVFISQRKNPLSWLHNDIRLFPRLEISIGQQTQARKYKASAARAEILGLSSQAQSRPASQFPANADQANKAADVHTPQVVKDRTLSLLDRVRAKGLAASTAPDSFTVLRRRAIGRISEVVEILRMKQQRKLGSSFHSSIHSSPSKVRGRVSFSLNQLVNEIKGSLPVPMGDTEIRKCFEILANDVPGMWLSIHTVGILQSVVLNGQGLSGMEVKKILDEDEKNKN
ncbi:hypothetical protein EDD37DRAFT_163616 [Exophiala viscosa]|uniref:DNA replication factor Cdt1 C-terminal domain-containing protein n=1 Tax=Exophiala viscosa TaxID=2486360 RepID=A0AAN6IA05_9EURO|nr:hypothetical protein EDD36DRAFT_422298 [Exophiala viscosa]KAI1620642.1 hypothetical protein EDD37DRAFT_163616 [Exophiala viscosa]